MTMLRETTTNILSEHQGYKNDSKNL